MTQVDLSTMHWYMDGQLGEKLESYAIMRQQQHRLVNVTFVDKQLKALQFELCFDN